MTGTHDTYIAEAPENLRPLLTRLRALLEEVLPDSEEVIAYKRSGFSIEGSIVAGYAAFSKQCGSISRPLPLKRMPTKSQPTASRRARRASRFRPPDRFPTNSSRNWRWHPAVP